MRTLTRVRVWLVVFVVGLIVSGVTAFPLESETRLIVPLFFAERGIRKLAAEATDGPRPWSMAERPPHLPGSKIVT